MTTTHANIQMPTAAAAMSLMTLIFSLWRSSTKSRSASIALLMISAKNNEGGGKEDDQKIDPGTQRKGIDQYDGRYDTLVGH
jgi:hypothetical protein